MNISPNSESNTCSDASFTDAITYGASVSGGNGDYQFAWTGCSSSSASCVVDPNDSTFCANQDVFVTVGDTSGICDASDSETESYEKVTVVTSTDN